MPRSEAKDVVALVEKESKLVENLKDSLVSRDYKLIAIEEYLDFVRASPATPEASQSFGRMYSRITYALDVILKYNCIPMFHSSFRSNAIVKAMDKAAAVYDHFKAKSGSTNPGL